MRTEPAQRGQHSESKHHAVQSIPRQWRPGGARSTSTSPRWSLTGTCPLCTACRPPTPPGARPPSGRGRHRRAAVPCRLGLQHGGKSRALSQENDCTAPARAITRALSPPLSVVPRRCSADTAQGRRQCWPRPFNRRPAIQTQAAALRPAPARASRLPLSFSRRLRRRRHTAAGLLPPSHLPSQCCPRVT